MKLKKIGDNAWKPLPNFKGWERISRGKWEFSKRNPNITLDPNLVKKAQIKQGLANEQKIKDLKKPVSTPKGIDWKKWGG